jgi:hypothetical protein
MEDRQRLELVQEIKELERKLYLKKSKLASAVGRGTHSRRRTSVARDASVEEWKKAMAELIALIGKHSKGGNSEEDVRMERNR